MGLGPRGRRFESCPPDTKGQIAFMSDLSFFYVGLKRLVGLLL